MAKKTKVKKRPTDPEDAFEAVAKRLGCDLSDSAFKEHLGKIAKPAKPRKQQ